MFHLPAAVCGWRKGAGKSWGAYQVLIFLNLGGSGRFASDVGSFRILLPTGREIITPKLCRNCAANHTVYHCKMGSTWFAWSTGAAIWMLWLTTAGGRKKPP